MSKILIKQPLPEQTKSRNFPIHIVYVVGSGRCGSTLLDRLLGLEPDIISVGELNRIWKTGMVLNSKCSCGQQFSECNFWGNVTKKAFGNWNENYGARLHTLRKQIIRFRKIPAMIRWHKKGIPLSGPVAEYADATINLYQAIRDISGKNIIVDSSKNCLFPLFLSALPELKLTVIHLIRDSRAVAYSWGKKKMRIPDSVTSENRMMPRYSSMHSSWDWTLSNSIGASLRWISNIKYLQLKYEDLVSESHTSRSILLSHIGIKHASHHKIVTSTDNPPCIFSGNPMRFNQGGISIHPDYEWKQQMKWSSKLTVSLLTLPGLIAYRYLPHMDKHI